MGHAEGEVIVDNKIIGYFDYNGIVDFASSRIFGTQKELGDNWRGDVFRECHCQPTGETPVILYSSYGGGFHWPSTACLTCRAITGQRDPYPDRGEGVDASDGHPFRKE